MNKSLTIQILKRTKLYFGLRTLACLINRVAYLLMPLIFGLSINHLVKGDYNGAFNFAIIGLVIGLIAKGSQLCKTYTWFLLSNKLTHEYTKIAGEKLFEKTKVDKHGEVLNVLTNDITVMSDFIPRMIRIWMRSIDLIFIFVYFYLVGFYFGFSATIAMLLCLAILYLAQDKIKSVNQEFLIASDKRISFVDKVINKRKSQEIPTKERLKDLVLDFAKKRTSQHLTEWTVKQLVEAIIETFRWGSVILSIYLFANGNIEIGVIVVLYGYYTSLNNSFKDLSELIITVNQWRVSKKRFIDFCENKEIK